MDSLHAYIPIDRRHALSQGIELSEWMQGAELFADISGFTPLTEGLVRAWSTPRRRSTYQSVPAADPATAAAQRAVACSLALQQAMVAFAAIALPDGRTTALTLKVAVTSGAARRFLVGDPAVQVLDVLARTTIARLATAEHLASAGDMLLDEASALARQQGLVGYGV